MKNPRVASIDIGSNAMRLLIAENNQGKLQIIETDRASVRLGGEVFENGILSEDIISRSVEAIELFKAKIEKAQVDRYRIIATSAMREAKNSQSLIKRVKDELDCNIEIIDGEEEARLVYLAVSESVEFSEGIDVLVDIGGGSVELTIVKSGDIIFSESIQMGSVRLIRLFGTGEISAQKFEHLVCEYSKPIRNKINEVLGSEKVDRCIGTGGNLETFLGLRQKFFNKEGNVLERVELEEILKKLQAYSVEDRISKLGLRADRADVVVPAAIVMLHVLSASRTETLVVPAVGVKEGVAYELIHGAREDDPHFRREKLMEAAILIGRKYHFLEKHAKCVSKLALDIFDQTKLLHKQSEEGRKLLEIASMLHDIGHYVSTRAHHKHSYYLIEAASFPGLTKQEKTMIACIARYHRKRFPQDNHVGYSSLTAQNKEIVSNLAAILRLADGLDRDNNQTISAVKLSKNDEQKKIDLVIEGEGDLMLDCWSGKIKSDLFEKVFGFKVEIVGA